MSATHVRYVNPSTQLLKKLFGEIVRYGLVSAIALAVDFGCLLVLAKSIHYLLAASISFALGGFVAYYLSINFVFDQRALDQATAEISLFIALGVVGLGINALIISIAISHWSTGLGLSKLLAAIGTFTCNFGLRKWLLFNSSHPAMQPAAVIDAKSKALSNT
jgi:putative flippase GtrA